MKITKKYYVYTSLLASVFLLTACDSSQQQQVGNVVEPKSSEPNQNETNNNPVGRAKPAFAMLTPATGTIYVLTKPVSAPADMSFKNACEISEQPIGLSDINFGGKLYCSDATTRSIHVLNLDTGEKLFSWAWPSDISATSQWLIGRWQADGEIGLAAYDAAKGVFTVFNQTDKNFIYNHAFEFGGPGNGSAALPLVGDWNGDGADSVGVYSSSMKGVYLRNTLDAGIADQSFGFVDGSVEPDAIPALVNVEARTAVAMYSSKLAGVVFGPTDQGQTPFLFGAPEEPKISIPVR